MKVIEPIEDYLESDLIAAMKDGRYVIIPKRRVVYYNKPHDPSTISGFGVPFDKIVNELMNCGEIHISPRLDYLGQDFEVLRAKDVVEIYTVAMRNGPWSPEPTNGRIIVPSQSGLRRILWRLSMM